jgi:ABC-2 type transport system permease protein
VGSAAKPAQAALFLVSMTLVVALASAIVMLLNIAVVVTLNDRGVNYLLSPFTIVLTGNLIPLSLYPDWMHRLLVRSTVRRRGRHPISHLSGNLHGQAAWAGIGLQIGWTLVLVAAGTVWMERAMRRLEVQGG